MKLKTTLLLGCMAGIIGCHTFIDFCPVTVSKNDPVFSALARSWDEGIPLGNGTIGALVWQKDNALRFSLDRDDLWDLRPIDSLSGDNYRFSWVKEHIRKQDYAPVQKKLDLPYVLMSGPSKIPGAAIEFPLSELGQPSQVRLYLNNALCEAIWENGTQMQTFVHATEPVGWFVFKNLKTELQPVLVAPKYRRTKTKTGPHGSGAVQDLQNLGYEQGCVEEKDNLLVYHQKGYGDFSYDVVVKWKQQRNTLYGTWSVTSSLCNEQAVAETEEAMSRGLKQDYNSHLAYWRQYWAQSSVSLPDSVLQKRYYNVMYRFSSAARENSYPISLQAVWTPDNDKLPPWKGDYHHDLNTQLSYWPAYAGNHLSEGMSYLNTLWNQRDTYKRFTRQYFETEGMNVPGVCTLTGEPMGGWIQYAMSQTTGAWLAQHFYLHWKYSADKVFLKERAYPFLKDVAIYLEQISMVDSKGIRRLEFSSSPEIFNNSLQAWFKDMTNYDLALMHFLFGAASEMADSLGIKNEAMHWSKMKSQLPDFDVDKEGSLTFSKGFPYNISHRHLSHVMAIHPLGLIDRSKGEKDRHIILASLKKIQEIGTKHWAGFTYGWYANLQARAFNGEEATKALRTFAENSIPFYLDENCPFAAGIHEMLLQSHSGYINIFPAVPAKWKNCSFENLRAEGAFLVSAARKDGRTASIKIFSEKGGVLRVKNPFGSSCHHEKAKENADNSIWEFECKPNETIVFTH